MKRTGFKRPERAQRGMPTLQPVRPVAATVISEAPTAHPKDRPARHEGYRRLVAALPCARCGKEGRSQAAHANTGKGMAIKADDRLCFPLCADEPGQRGCHSQFDQGAMLGREERHEAERTWVSSTAATITALGLWPKDLPRLSEASGNIN